MCEFRYNLSLCCIGCRPAEARGISWNNALFQTSRIKQMASLGNGQIVDRVKAEGLESITDT